METITQGKWIIRRNPTTKGTEIWAKSGMTGSKICDIHDDMPRDCFIANARLIAEAPEMLRVLQAAHLFISEALDKGRLSVEVGDEHDAVNLVFGIARTINEVRYPTHTLNPEQNGNDHK